ncbi:MAG: type III-A CRISPR-associated RAMP protein Csm5 [Chloroflexota bacterium]|jgi:CRISPR-associated protein Csm5
MTTHKLTLRTLSPVHIGTGEEWRLGFDFVLANGQTWIFNEDAVLQAKESQLKPDGRGHYPLPGGLLTEKDLDNPNLFRYVLRGQPPSEKADARMKPFIKDPYDRPYIPGSSLKGAFRTALAWTGWNEVRIPRLRREDIGRSRSWAGNPLEKKIFGKDPNYDLLRAMQVSDLHGPQKPGEGLIALKAQVLTQSAAQSPIGLEALVSEVEFHGSLTIDDALFKPMAARLGFSDRKRWLDELLPRAQKHSRARLQKLVAWFENVEPPAPSAERIARFYRDLLSVQLSPRQALVQIGWGAGWDGKTFWTHLQQDEYLFERLVSEFRLDKAGKRSKRQIGDPFPTSRRVAVSGKKDEAKPVAPFGWALVEIGD